MLRLPPPNKLITGRRPLAKAQAKAQAFPLLPLAAALCIVVALAQIAAWGYQSLRGTQSSPMASQTASPMASQTASQTAPQMAAQGNPFGALVSVQQRHAAARAVAERQPRRLSPPPGPPLRVLGNPQGAVTLTLLLDPALASHRQQLQAWLNLSGRNVRAELRFTPGAEGNLAGGIILNMAQAQGKLPALWQLLTQQRGNLTEAELLALLAEVGVPLATIRAALSNPATLAPLQPTLVWANAYQLTPPVLLLDGFVVEEPAMNPALLPRYIQRRLQGEALIQPADFL